MLEELNKEIIFICSDEKYHEIENVLRFKNVIVFEEVLVEIAVVFKTKIQFIVM